MIGIFSPSKYCGHDVRFAHPLLDFYGFNFPLKECRIETKNGFHLPKQCYLNNFSRVLPRTKREGPYCDVFSPLNLE